MGERRDRVALDPHGYRVAIRADSFNDWFVFRTDLVKGEFRSTLPDDWTAYVPATDRDRLADQVEQFAEQAEEIATGLAWLQARSQAGSPGPVPAGGEEPDHG
jgi:hypothetical protein